MLFYDTVEIIRFAFAISLLGNNNEKYYNDQDHKDDRHDVDICGSFETGISTQPTQFEVLIFLHIICN